MYFTENMFHDTSHGDLAKEKEKTPNGVRDCDFC